MSGYRFETVPEVRDGLKSVNYLADDGIAGVVYPRRPAPEAGPRRRARPAPARPSWPSRWPR